MLKYQRKSIVEIGKIYFWTATINQWIPLLLDDHFKEIIISSLTYLSRRKKIDVFAFVVMPNHIHLIWRINELNGKESAHGSFLKFTAHEFKKRLIDQGSELLARFKVNASNKEYEFWQRDSLAIPIYTRDVALQKLDYIHNNPMADHWSLVNDPNDYYYSSCGFSEQGQTNFPFLKDLLEEV